MIQKIAKKVKHIVVYLLVISMLGVNITGLHFLTIVAHAAGDLPNANGADGSQSKPFIINEASDFTWVTSNSNARSSYLLQTADIDLTGFTWVPIGPDNATLFSGTYDGNGYTISNMTLNDGTLAYIGMFGYTLNATIKNVTLSNVSFTGGQNVNQVAIGAVAGMTTGTTAIERCHVVGTSTITGATNDTLGGVVGSNGASIRYCSNTATISSSNFDSGSRPNSGGIAGSNWGSIDNCFNKGNVSAGTGTAAGGIVGFGYSNELLKCYSIGTVVVGAGSEGGAIIGNITNASNVSGNYYLSGVAANGIGKLDSVSGPSEVGTTAAAAANLKLEETYTGSGWDFTGKTWTLQAGVNNDYPFIKGVATVDRTSATALTTSATVGGNVLSTGYGTITEKGIEYTKLTENDFKIKASTVETGAYNIEISDLAPDTQYYVRAYAINEVGTSYGEPMVFRTNPLAPQMTLNVSQGSALGTTKVAITDVATDHFVVNITDASVGYVEAGDVAPSSGVNYSSHYISGSDISTGVAVGKYLQIYDVNDLGKVVKFNEIQLKSEHIRMANLTLPIHEGFENAGSLPENWKQEVVADNGSEVIWSCIDTNMEDSVTANPNTGNYMAKVDFYSADVGSSSRLSLVRDFSLPAGGFYEFSFFMFHSTPIDYGPNDSIQPQITTDGGATWANLGDAIKRVNGDSGWVKHTISLNDYAGQSNVRIGFLGISDYGYSVFIDDVEVKALLLDAKVLTTDTTNNDVDHNLEITFASDAAFEDAITSVSYNGNTLDPSQYVVSSGKVTLKPSADGNTYLRTPGTGDIVITATGYTNSVVSQTINAGAVASLEVTIQPVPGAASGEAFATQPVVKLKDQYGNYCTTGISATADIVATARAGTGAWTIGGIVTKAAVAGTATFTDLTCTFATEGNGSLTFTSGVKAIDSAEFAIPRNAAKTLTADTMNNDVDYDLEITFASDAAFEGAITSVSYNGNTLDSSQYVVSSGKVTLKPSAEGNTYLRTPGTGDIVITATGYTNSVVSQTINAGAVTSLEIAIQPIPGAASGEAFATQPVVKLKDQYGNYCTTGISATVDVVATAKAGTGTWAIGGIVTKAAVAGTAAFTNLTCTFATEGNGSLTFTSGVKAIDSAEFAIPRNAAKTLTADTMNNDVDYDLEITFASDAAFEGAITSVSYNGNTLDSSQYVVSSSKVTLKPSADGNTYLRTPGTGDIVITATGYTNSTVSQTINAGAVTSLEIAIQPIPGAASGEAFATQPVVKLKDQYGNYCTTGISATADVVATAKAGTGTWAIGGIVTKAAVAGTATFTDLTCTFATEGNGSLTFTSGVKAIDSAEFAIPRNAAKTLNADTTNNDVDHDLEITFSTDATFEDAITSVAYNGNTLDLSQYVVSSGKVTLKPSVDGNTYLRAPGSGNVVITATGYTNSVVSQAINAGIVDSLEVTIQPVPGAETGNTFATQPVITLKDKYGNLCADGSSATAEVTASAAAGTGTWTIGGVATKSALNGVTTFTDLTCTLVTSGDGKITFTCGTKIVDSNLFAIPERNSTITPITGEFDKYTNATNYKDISITLTLNGNTLSSIKNGANMLVANTDYTVTGNDCTIKKEYLKNLNTGTATLTFDFSLGADPVLVLTVSNTTPTGGGSSSTPTQTSTVVEVNGEKQDAGSVTTQTTGNQTVTTITVDDAKLNKILESKAEKPTVTLPTSTTSDVVVGQLNGQTVKNMEAKDATLEIKTETVSYTVPASQINIDAVSSQIGSQVELKDIKVSVKIAEPPADTVKVVEDTAKKNSYQIVVKPVEFEITCTSGNRTVAVSQFNGYVERTVAIPDGIDPSKITTGIVLNADGTFRHVPTQILVINGKYYAKINSLTNSTYSVIWNPVEFADVTDHWAKKAINDMGSRMVVTGTGNKIYEPDRSITRAEFAAIVVRAMGLAQGTTESSFGDVKLSDWFNGYVSTATAYGLISGYSDMAYGPNDTITREQAMAILARAMQTTGLNVNMTDTEVDTILSNYTDGNAVSDYAKAGVTACLKSGVITGTSTSALSPKAYVTRAEVAVMVQNLLQRSQLI